MAEAAAANGDAPSPLVAAVSAVVASTDRRRLKLETQELLDAQYAAVKAAFWRMREERYRRAAQSFVATNEDASLLPPTVLYYSTRVRAPETSINKQLLTGAWFVLRFLGLYVYVLRNDYLLPEGLPPGLQTAHGRGAHTTLDDALLQPQLSDDDDDEDDAALLPRHPSDVDSSGSEDDDGDSGSLHDAVGIAPAARPSGESQRVAVLVFPVSSESFRQLVNPAAPNGGFEEVPFVANLIAARTPAVQRGARHSALRTSASVTDVDELSPALREVYVAAYYGQPPPNAIDCVYVAPGLDDATRAAIDRALAIALGIDNTHTMAQSPLLRAAFPVDFGAAAAEFVGDDEQLQQLPEDGTVTSSSDEDDDALALSASGSDDDDDDEHSYDRYDSEEDGDFQIEEGLDDGDGDDDDGDGDGDDDDDFDEDCCDSDDKSSEEPTSKRHKVDPSLPSPE